MINIDIVKLNTKEVIGSVIFHKDKCKNIILEKNNNKYIDTNIEGISREINNYVLYIDLKTFNISEESYNLLKQEIGNNG